jgi:hypothetical protein
MRIGRSIVQALNRFVTAPGVAVSPEKATEEQYEVVDRIVPGRWFLVRPSPGTGK